jgi:hypothetical protein
MEKARFKEAKKQVEIIDACEYILDVDIDYADIKDSFAHLVANKDPNGLILKLLWTDKHVQRSFLRWVENEKAIAEQKFKEI